jgi:serine/threonine protein kinase
VGTLEDLMAGNMADVKIEEMNWLRQLALGIEHIHSKNYVHGNVEPRNILVSRIESKTVLKISGFNCCTKAAEKLPLRSYSVNRKYAAPELLQFLEKKEDAQAEYLAKIESDVFSLGIVFFKIATKGIHPFGGSIGKVVPKGKQGKKKQNQRLLRSAKDPLMSESNPIFEKFNIESNIIQGKQINCDRKIHYFHS